MSWLWAVCFLTAIAFGWLLQLVGLFGNWIIVAAALVYALVQTSDSRMAIAGSTVIALIGLAVVGEIVELVAGAYGVSRKGGSRRAALLAIIGSVIGSTFGLTVGLPLPVIGPMIGAVVGAGIGALGGAVLGELWKGRDLDASLDIGKAAFFTRLAGSLAKIAIGCVMFVVAALALLAR